MAAAAVVEAEQQPASETGTAETEQVDPEEGPSSTVVSEMEEVAAGELHQPAQQEGSLPGSMEASPPPQQAAPMRPPTSMQPAVKLPPLRNYSVQGMDATPQVPSNIVAPAPTVVGNANGGPPGTTAVAATTAVVSPPRQPQPLTAASSPPATLSTATVMIDLKKKNRNRPFDGQACNLIYLPIIQAIIFPICSRKCENIFFNFLF